MSFANIYTHRKVAETAAKGCDVCYRATSSVLVASENKDFFYVCPSHLKDKEKEKAKDNKKNEDEKKEDGTKSSENDGPETPTPSTEEEPRVFALHKNFYGIRLEKKRQMEIAKRNRERLQQPNLFPSVPKGAPGAPST
ncbi:DUF1742-domain-containing protein [Colletotrichum falcatum]|nr:DUF1742-domain-containing protein [Colletotrichum falcatum]